MQAETEDRAPYIVTVTSSDDETIAKAIAILYERMKEHPTVLSSPHSVKDYLTLTLAQLEHEVFVVVFLNAQNRLIESEELFRGTLTHTSVYPREVVKTALKHNAAAVILAHNHPSGNADPSSADRIITDALKSALALVDVRVLDHVIVAGRTTISFAEHGWL